MAFFLALAVPSAILIDQAFGRLEWEAFHQQQVLAEGLARRIDARLAALVDAESARGFADYGFLVVEGDPDTGYLQRSPLSVYPPRAEIPGLIGYFQVDAEGLFSSPLLPRGSIDPARYGLSATEVAERRAAEGRLEQILGSNRLVEDRRGEHEKPGTVGPRRRPATPPLATSPGPRPDAQLNFDRLNERQARIKDGGAGQEQGGAELTTAKADQAPAAPAGRSQAQPPMLPQGPVQARVETGWRGGGQVLGQNQIARSSRRELTVLPESEPPAEQPAEQPADQRAERSTDSRAARPAASPPAAKAAQPAPATSGKAAGTGDQSRGAASETKGEPDPTSQRPRIRTFESEIDPFEVSRLADGQLVLYRKVWRNGQRYTQGALIDPGPFVDHLLAAPFRDATLARATDLSVTWRGEPLGQFAGRPERDYGPQGLSGTPLYQTRLSAPWGEVGLWFSIARLPLGPGAELIAWMAAALTVVLCGGVFALYRLGVRQIHLVRQQQDFVSAVSHELKTPLTSIRMYGEMLRAGWVPDDKRPGYYQFIYDESERLSRLINNVLQLARMTHGDHRLELRPFACAELMELVRAKVSSPIEAAGFALRLLCPPEAARLVVRVDPDAFAQVFINLVDNALKFSSKARVKEVEIGCAAVRGGALQFWVRDHGPGVPPNQVKKVFRLFYRAEGALRRETLGTGIGLALVRGLVEAMGGAIDLTNRDPGAELRLTLPSLTAPVPGPESPRPWC